MKKMEKVAHCNTEKSVEEMFAEFKPVYLDTLFTVETDWSDDEPCKLLKLPNSEDYVIAFDGLTISHCPSNVDDIDIDLVFDAVKCFLFKYGSYAFMGLDYRNLENDIRELYMENY